MPELNEIFQEKRIDAIVHVVFQNLTVYSKNVPATRQLIFDPKTRSFRLYFVFDNFQIIWSRENPVSCFVADIGGSLSVLGATRGMETATREGYGPFSGTVQDFAVIMMLENQLKLISPEVSEVLQPLSIRLN